MPRVRSTYTKETMTRRDQHEFVRDLLHSIGDEIIGGIEEGKLPEEWDGHELRALIAEKARQSAAMSQIIREPRSRRARAYNNEVIIKNL